MTESADSSGLTPEQDAVRRLLADARHDGPTPPAVVARLDDALAAMAAERSRAVHTAPVVDLAARRRRFVGAGVLAAAAVVVAGVALGQVIPRGGSDSGGDTASSATDGGASMESQAGGAESGGGDGGGDGGGPAADSTSPEALSGKSAAPQGPEVSLDSDLDDALTSLRTSHRRSAALTGETLVACQVGEVGRGRQVLVQVDGRPGLVVFRAARGSGQDADVYLCGDPEPVRTLTLPAP